jgi:imidazole glycerol-phosphate synthase subunit HisH
MIAIINYNAGNTTSVLYALQRLGFDAIITNDVQEIKNAAKVILPGVGHAAFAMETLDNLGLATLIPTLQQPVLGICLGMQLLCNFSEEGNTKCLGIFNTEVKKFVADKVKVPQIGWNNVATKKSPLFNGFSEEAYAYFVHSYYVSLCKETIATTDYIEVFSAALQKDNFYACQFHPEKSSQFGDTILKNFLLL